MNFLIPRFSLQVARYVGVLDILAVQRTMQRFRENMIDGNREEVDRQVLAR